MNKLMTHMVCGYPNIAESQKIFDILKQKSEYIEIQFPFSDPIADGPVIEEANKIALQNGITTNDCFDFCEKNTSPLTHPPGGLSLEQSSTHLDLLKGEGDIKNPKILIMTYYNIVLNYGVEDFVKKAKSIGIYGLIIPDVPFDEEDGENFRKICKKYDLVFTEIVSPVTTNSRLEEIKNLNPELIYAISQNMTTGSKAEFGEEFEKYIKNLKIIFKNSPLQRGARGANIGVGFGVKTKQDIEKVCSVADFAIIGSEFIKKYAPKEVPLGDTSGGNEEVEKYLEKIS